MHSSCVDSFDVTHLHYTITCNLSLNQHHYRTYHRVMLKENIERETAFLYKELESYVLLEGSTRTAVRGMMTESVQISRSYATVEDC